MRDPIKTFAGEEVRNRLKDAPGLDHALLTGARLPRDNEIVRRLRFAPLRDDVARLARQAAPCLPQVPLRILVRVIAFHVVGLRMAAGVHALVVHDRRYYWIALKIVRSEAAAEDVIGETGLKLHRTIDSGVRIRRLRPFLNRVVHNTAVSYARAAAREPSYDPDSLPHPLRQDDADQADERVRDLVEHWERLPPAEKAALQDTLSGAPKRPTAREHAAHRKNLSRGRCRLRLLTAADQPVHDVLAAPASETATHMAGLWKSAWGTVTPAAVGLRLALLDPSKDADRNAATRVLAVAEHVGDKESAALIRAFLDR